MDLAILQPADFGFRRARAARSHCFSGIGAVLRLYTVMNLTIRRRWRGFAFQFGLLRTAPFGFFVSCVTPVCAYEVERWG
jgi:hypothetical protein